MNSDGFDEPFEIHYSLSAGKMVRMRLWGSPKITIGAPKLFIVTATIVAALDCKRQGLSWFALYFAILFGTFAVLWMVPFFAGRRITTHRITLAHDCITVVDNDKASSIAWNDIGSALNRSTAIVLATRFGRKRLFIPKSAVPDPAALWMMLGDRLGQAQPGGKKMRTQKLITNVRPR